MTRKSPNTATGLAEIAKRTGKSRAAITYKAQQGKVIKKDGKIDVEASVALILAEDETRKHHKPRKNAKKVVVIDENETGQPSQPSTETWSEAQLRKERALADLRELELAEKQGRLIDAELAAQFLSNASRTVTNQIMAIPDKLAPLIAAVTDIRECRDLMLKEIKRALDNLPDQIRLVGAA
jgi:phage terminase Nu1 subunit (DNA packaging protein)